MHRQTHKSLEHCVLLDALEELALPLFALLLLRLAHSALAVLDDGLFGGGRIHITLVYGIGDLLPCFSRLKVVLLFDGRNVEGGWLRGGVVESVHDLQGVG